MSEAFLVIYFLVLLIPSVFGIHRYYLVWQYYRTKDRKHPSPDFSDLKQVPFVTVQLPIFNERYVAPRLIETVCNFDYPREAMEIQVLDDSNDETVAIVAREVSKWKAKGFQIEHIRREKREGFKAGALNVGLQVARGEFVAVFDADFLPESDFLRKLIPHFVEDANVGMVQARWGHVNRDYSLLTQAQSILLDGHFVIEHTARNRTDCFFNFNGTAGVWRRSCIEAAGGWSGETLTEDIDLSYRAQLAGWKFVYLNDVVAPAELPVDINALKTQQHRWAKGSVQVARKLLPAILRSSQPFRVKVEAFFHLAGNLNYLLVAILSFMMPISLYIRHEMGWDQFMWIDLIFFLSATWSVSVFYYHAQREIHDGLMDRLKYIPLSLAVGIGLCVNNAKAVIEGMSNKSGEFTRTPKFAVIQKGDSWKDKTYRGKWNSTSLVEVVLMFHFFVATLYVLTEGLYFSFPFVLLFLVGFGYTVFLSFFQGISSEKLIPSPAQIS